MNPNLGRWPPNLVLMHLPGCQEKGKKKVKTSSGGVRTTAFWSSGGVRNDGWVERDQRPWIQADGLESVPTWVCQEGCPITALDQQSGLLTSGKLRSDSYAQEDRDNSSIFAGKGQFTHQGYEADSGGASRFFPQFRAEAELDAWLLQLLLGAGEVGEDGA